MIANGDRYVISGLVDGVWQVSFGGCSGNTECSVVEFLSQLLNQVKAGIELASSKPLEAAMSNPIQGKTTLCDSCQLFVHAESRPASIFIYLL